MDTKKIEAAYLGLLKTGINPYASNFSRYLNRPPGSHYAKYTAGAHHNNDLLRAMAYLYTNVQDNNIRHDIPAYASDYLHNQQVIDQSLIQELDQLGIKNNSKKSEFTFIDLFAGIGGFRLILDKLGGNCVFSSEFEANARHTYYTNFGEWPFGDIHHYGVQNDGSCKVPNHDILVAGFPCQPFSVAGQKLGFNDARGTLFFEILKIAQHLRPRALVLENVANLKSHDNGRTFRVIHDSLTSIGYNVHDAILNAKDFGVPQRRNRIFIVAFSTPLEFKFPKPTGVSTKVGDILEASVDQSYTLSDKLWSGHQNRKILHRATGKGFTYRLFNTESPQTSTLTARYGKDGKEILIDQANANPRMLTPRECARLQGFPDSYQLQPAKTISYKLLGNSVALPVIKALMIEVLKTLNINYGGNDANAGS